MRCVVDGCRPVFSLISLSDTVSSREASTSITENMRSSTWMVGLAMTPGSLIFMTAGWEQAVILSGEIAACCGAPKSAGRGVAWNPLSLDQNLVRPEAGLVVHLRALADPVA